VNGHASTHIFRLDKTQDKNHLVEGIKEGLAAADNQHLKRRSSTNQRTEGDHQGRCSKLAVN
jgi:hypothetical protein